MAVQVGEKMEVRETLRCSAWECHVVRFSGGDWGFTSIHDQVFSPRDTMLMVLREPSELDARQAARRMMERGFPGGQDATS